MSLLAGEETATALDTGAQVEVILGGLDRRQRRHLHAGGENDGVNDCGLSLQYIRQQVEASLERLGTGYTDVYYIHRQDGSAAIEDTLSTLSTLSALVDEGINYLGASTITA